MNAFKFIEDENTINPEIVFTPHLNKKLLLFQAECIRAVAQESYKYFPELKSTTIKLGKRTSSLAVAYTNGYTVDSTVIFIGIHPKYELSYNTMGHELTHFAQQITGIPSGEKACDVFTLARNKLFADTPPNYINIPSKIKDSWVDYKDQVRELCVDAVKIRETKRQYIKWLELECKKL